ncbi:hypothetical protein AB3M95_24030 [Metabacillus niabensis]
MGEKLIKIPASHLVFDLWRLGESGGYIDYSSPIIMFCFTQQQYDCYVLLGENK